MYSKHFVFLDEFHFFCSSADSLFLHSLPSCAGSTVEIVVGSKLRDVEVAVDILRYVYKAEMQIQLPSETSFTRSEIAGLTFEDLNHI